jgi:hypothetical protein
MSNQGPSPITMRVRFPQRSRRLGRVFAEEPRDSCPDLVAMREDGHMLAALNWNLHPGYV